MSCNCKLYQKRLEKLRDKYATLRKNHKKLLGVTVLLTDALEKILKEGKKTKVNDILLLCSTLYPDLFDNGNFENQEKEILKDQINSNPIEEVENVKMVEIGTESEREYFEGFMARPKIPRTPQV